MKKIYALIACVISILSVISCDDFMDVHKEYIEGGEIIYAPKPDSLRFIAGKGRILFKCRMYNAPNVGSIDVYWNDGLDSLIIPAELNTGYDSISVMLDNMEEKSYTFNVRTTDNFGHKSLYLTDFGTSYGDIFQSSLNDRRIKSISLLDEEGILEWYSAANGLVKNEIRYVKKNGAEVVVEMPSAEYITKLPDAAPGSSVEYRSLYIPEKACIDTFFTAWNKYETSFPEEYEYDRSSWQVLSVSDIELSDGGGMGSILDGDFNTYWHSAYEDGNAPLPHWAVVDMKTPKKISRVELHRRSANKDTKSVELYVSDQSDANAGNWVNIGNVVFGDASNISLTIPESVDTTKGRYLKLLLPDSNREPFTNIVEIYVFGK